MKGFVAVIIIAAVVFGFWFYKKGGKEKITTNLTITDNEVTFSTSDLNVKFSIYNDFEGVYMVFGGATTTAKNALNPITLATLNIYDAQKIYVDYPDFYKCSSKGAKMAKQLIRQLNLIPANSEIYGYLKQYYQMYMDNLKSGGDQVCLNFKGSYLDLNEVRLKGGGPDIAKRFKNQSYILVDSVMDVNCKKRLDEN